MPLPENTQLGAVHLIVTNLDLMDEFYRKALGFHTIYREHRTTHLGPVGGPDIVVLSEDTAATPPPVSTGLYHFAVLFPSRANLAQALRRLVESGNEPEGVADHGVSEALYLSDPEGNGIELYWDRSRQEWPYRNGQIQMVTEQLDLEGLMGSLHNQPAAVDGIPTGTRLGHIHLKVRDVPEAIHFYTDILGFDLMQTYGPSAGFVSVGGYHHHIGFNTWESAGAGQPPEGSRGLEYFELIIPDQDPFEAAIERLRQAGLEPAASLNGFLVRDPSGNGILIARTRPASTLAGYPRD